MQVQLRPARARDLDAICALDSASFSQPWSRASFERAMSGASSLVIVAEIESEIARVLAAQENAGIVGFGVAQVTLDECEIATLAVAQSARASGIGARILASLCEFGASRGAARTFLEVRPSNGAARTLYARHGFEEVGRRRAYYSDGEDALILCRDHSRRAA